MREEYEISGSEVGEEYVLETTDQPEISDSVETPEDYDFEEDAPSAEGDMRSDPPEEYDTKEDFEEDFDEADSSATEQEPQESAEDYDDAVQQVDGSSEVTGDSAYAQLQAYMESHNYGRQHEAVYTQDPQWQRLNNAFRVEQGLEPIDYGQNDWTDTHVEDVRRDLEGWDIPADSPELAAILRNEQKGVDEIRAEKETQ